MEQKIENIENKLLVTQQDLYKIYPYLNGVVNLEIKQYRQKREILLEYSNGKKYIGDLNAPKFKPTELKGLTSIAAYFARGKYGSNSWRGNCSGLLIKDLLEYYKPNFVIDPMCGSNTTGNVCKDLNIPHLSLDLNPDFGGFNVLRDELKRSSPFIFLHPPYYVYPGSAMPVYSGSIWGDKPHNDDGSHIHDKTAYIRWLNQCEANLYQALRKGGHMAILIGDSRFKGQYFSPYKAMDIYGEIESVIIKRQYNCISDNIQYSGKFISIEHEYLILIKKNDEYLIPCLIVRSAAANIIKSKKITWRTLIQSAIEHLGGRATRQQILAEIKDNPKAKSNNHLEEKIRQVVNTFNSEFMKYENGMIGLAA